MNEHLGAPLSSVAALAADVVARHDPADPFDERRDAEADRAFDAAALRLMDDVHRIADGVGSILELAIKVAPRHAVPATSADHDAIDRYVGELRRLKDEALDQGATFVQVPGPLLSIALSIIDAHVRRG